MKQSELLTLLKEVNQHLNTPCDVILIGGAAMILHYGAIRATRDVDILIGRGDPQELRKAVKAVAQGHALSETWMNDAAKGFADILPRDFYHRLIPLDVESGKLRLYVLGRPEQVAIKIVALREQDLEDLEILLPEMSVDDRRILVEIMHHVATFRTDWAQKIRYFLLEQGWEIE
ncbi:MAG: DUF6036 family nucleotidyltransferase [Anaerolineales bacterium]